MSKPRKYEDTYRLLITAGVTHAEADQIAREAEYETERVTCPRSGLVFDVPLYPMPPIVAKPVYIQMFGRALRPRDLTAGFNTTA